MSHGRCVRSCYFALCLSLCFSAVLLRRVFPPFLCPVSCCILFCVLSPAVFCFVSCPRGILFCVLSPAVFRFCVLSPAVFRFCVLSPRYSAGILFPIQSPMLLCGQGIVNRFVARFAVQRYENICICAIFFAYL